MDKILVIGSFPAPYRVEVFKGLQRRYDLDVFFVTTKDEQRDSKFFINNTEFKYFLLSDPEDKRLYFKKLRNIKQYKCVLAYDWYLADAMYAEIVAKIFNVPYVINCDGALPDSYRRFKAKDIAKKFFVSNAALCFASGDHAYNYFLHYGAQKVKIIKHNFTSLFAKDIHDTAISNIEKKHVRKKLNIPNKRVVISVGQFVERKGYDLLIEAWKKVDDRYHLILIGGGPQKEEYDKLIKNYGLTNISLIEYVPHSQVLEYMLASDLFVLPTREDIWGLVVNEAMANWLPVITTNRCVAGAELLQKDCVIEIEKFIVKFPLVLNSIFEGDEIGAIAERNHSIISDYTYESIIDSHLYELEKL